MQASFVESQEHRLSETRAGGRGTNVSRVRARVVDRPATEIRASQPVGKDVERGWRSSRNPSQEEPWRDDPEPDPRDRRDQPLRRRAGQVPPARLWAHPRAVSGGQVCPHQQPCHLPLRRRHVGPAPPRDLLLEDGSAGRPGDRAAHDSPADRSAGADPLPQAPRPALLEPAHERARARDPEPTPTPWSTRFSIKGSASSTRTSPSRCPATPSCT